MHEAGARLVLQLNERSFSVIQPDLGVGPEIPIKGYIYGVAASRAGLLTVATAGAGVGARYFASWTDRDVPLISKVRLLILAEPVVLSSISVPISMRVSHMSPVKPL